jgi:hypothetical protein
VGHTVRRAVTFGLSSIAAASFGSSCRSCDEYATASLTAYVTDAAGAAVCDAVVTATDGAEVFPMENHGDCSYTGPWERAGTYVVTVSHGGQETRSDPVRVRSGACHVSGKRVDLVASA